jgi:hypothetical protein
MHKGTPLIHFFFYNFQCFLCNCNFVLHEIIIAKFLIWNATCRCIYMFFENSLKAVKSIQALWDWLTIIIGIGISKYITQFVWNFIHKTIQFHYHTWLSYHNSQTGHVFIIHRHTVDMWELFSLVSLIFLITKN